LTEIGKVVAGIGHSEFTRRVAVRGDDELSRLAQGINEMAAAGAPERGIAWLERISAAAGLALPALIIGNGPAHAFEQPSGEVPRLWLSRPFRPARLRALIDRLLTFHEAAR
jgi:hypothetical protein